MKFILMLALAVAFVPEQSLGLTDKQKHFAVSAGMAIGGYAALRRMDYSPGQSAAISAIGTLILGFGKEFVVDERADMGDVTANLLGIYSGLMIPLVFRF